MDEDIRSYRGLEYGRVEGLGLTPVFKRVYHLGRGKTYSRGVLLIPPTHLKPAYFSYIDASHKRNHSLFSEYLFFLLYHMGAFDFIEIVFDRQKYVAPHF